MRELVVLIQSLQSSVVANGALALIPAVISPGGGGNGTTSGWHKTAGAACCWWRPSCRAADIPSGSGVGRVRRLPPSDVPFRQRCHPNDPPIGQPTSQCVSAKPAQRGPGRRPGASAASAPGAGILSQLCPGEAASAENLADSSAEYINAPAAPNPLLHGSPPMSGAGAAVGVRAERTAREGGSGGETEGNKERSRGRRYHVVVSTDGNHYTTWQTRIMYYWYCQAKKAYPDSDMGGFTRLLHSGKPDRWMDEMPTVVVNGLDSRFADRSYPVLNRPYAFQQWLATLDIEEDYIFMSEPDHLIIKPPPNWATAERPAGYPFTYMDPKKFPNELGQFVDFGNNRHIRGVEKQMDPLGNAPVIIHKQQLQRIAPLWTTLSLRMKQNSAVNRAFGWIQEMYAFSLASAIVDKQPIRYDMHMEFMVQPPWDAELRVRCWPPAIIQRCPMRDVYIIHYTYGMDVDSKGHFNPGRIGYWHWDKRDYITRNLPGHIRPPPPGTGESIVKLVAMINEASQALWPSGKM